MSNTFRLYTTQRRFLKKIISPLLGQYYRRPFSGKRRGVLIVFFDNAVAISQVHPFFYYCSDLVARYDIDLRAMSFSDFIDSGRNSPCGADFVALQTWFDLDDDLKSRIFQNLSVNHPAAKVLYLDWFAPLDLRFAEFLSDKINLYVKKQIFRARIEYGKPTYGATNLEQYYGQLYGLELARKKFNVPESFFQKLILGPGFFTHLALIDRFVSPQPPSNQRYIDVHARIATNKSDWYGKMRQDALKPIQAVKGRKILTDFGVKRSQFYRELYRSKICFSPFGYGEVCLRDYEAIMAGCMLIKPDMSHLITEPEVFIPFETYVPVNWQFSDLREKVEYYLSDDAERWRIAQNAYEILHKYVAEKRFVDFAGKLFSV
jgi:hypothetical protein